VSEVLKDKEMRGKYDQVRRDGASFWTLSCAELVPFPDGIHLLMGSTTLTLFPATECWDGRPAQLAQPSLLPAESQEALPCAGGHTRPPYPRTYAHLRTQLGL